MIGSTSRLRSLSVALVVLAPAAGLAHEDPPGCFQTGPAIVVSMFRADGSTGVTGSVSECEHINYRATLRKAVDSDAICAFSGGTFTFTTPDGVVHTISSDVPCIGGTSGACDPSVDALTSDLIPYTVRAVDAASGLVTATATYAGGIAHDSSTDTGGVAAMAPKAAPIVLCDDNDACTQDTCGDGACQHVTPDPTCVPCATAAECNDNDACTTDTCQAGVCHHATPDPTCVPCATSADCNDNDACTTDTCDGGVCGHATPDPTCVACTTAAQCNDGNACTTDTCPEGACVHTGVPGCMRCETAAQCDDGNACTDDTCESGVCQYVTPDPTCVPCTSAAQCNDGNGCTTDTCAAGVCAHLPVAGCTRCETAADCNDGNTCTTDACTGGTCTHTPIPGCPIEICDDGVDNDGDGLVDCQDPDCKGSPNCPTEICDNCIDDDGDGKIDLDDEDCCENPPTLSLRKMSVLALPDAGKNTLHLKARYASQPPAGFDPGVLGTHLQIRDSQGTLYCHNLPFHTDAKWAMMGVWMLRDKTGLEAAGIRRAIFKILHHKDGSLVFGAKGKKMTFREPAGSDLTVTMRVGNECKRVTTAMRVGKTKKGRLLVFP